MWPPWYKDSLLIGATLVFLSLAWLAVTGHC